MDVKASLDKLKKLVIEEKKQLDYILKGAELLADMLAAQQQSGNEGKEIEHNQPPLASEQDTRERTPLYSAP